MAYLGPSPVKIAQGGTSVTSVTTAPTATSFAGWDANKNLTANNLIQSYTTTATAAGTTTLTVGSTAQQYFTGVTTQTVRMPVTSTLVLGQQFTITNNSTGIVTVQSSGANVIQAMAAGTTLTLTVINTAVTTAAGWSFLYSGAGYVITQVNIQTFTSSGTYTPTAGMQYCIVECVGAGGGAGGSNTPPGSCGAGGGAGGYCKNVFSAAAIGASKAVTIGTGGAGGVNAGAPGAGGATTFGALLTANGGGAAQATSNSSARGFNYIGGTGGTAAGGSVNIQGGAGANSCYALDSGLLYVFGLSGNGGSSYFGGGGLGGTTSNGANGAAYGSGGGGGNNSSVGATGGAGASGLVIVTEYI